MGQMSALEIRERFNQYFIKNGHQKIASSPLVPLNDPTLLFANAGMNQFKDIFTGKSQTQHKRAVTVQKCVRAGGKHNDLENVGFTARHHTFFEMLGNFSFGDYFKEEAIRFAWDFLTNEIKLPANLLCVSVHYSDEEAYQIWNKKMGIPAERIFKKGDKDNFWEMGEFGPCGPCSEIYYDRRPMLKNHSFTPGPNQDLLDDDLGFIEIWNLVFMQYEKNPQGRFNLPRPSIDTGAGLERLSAVVQGKFWNYDTDLFMPIIKKLEQATKRNYSNEKDATSMRVVADHIRASTMLITDGALPSNEGRGYVLRRIIRRAVRHLKELNAPDPFFHELVESVFEILGHEYPENASNKSLAKKILLLEEKKFRETLDHGMKYLDDSIQNMNGKILSGSEAFKLYDTFGFPLDLTQVILAEKGLSVDSNEFEKVMEQRKEESRKTWKGGTAGNDKIFYEAKEKFGTTEFVGYQSTQNKAKLLAILDLGEQKGLIFNKTPFYGESGGQVGDKGVILLEKNKIAEIVGTQKPVDGLFVHLCANADALEIGDEYTLQVDSQLRSLTARNHSATHLLQSALIKVLGDHVKQAGSSVGPDRLRFDFTHLQAVTAQELSEVEKIVNQQIKAALPVTASIMTKEKAVQKGAMALFGEKYGDEVRVLEMGQFSTELCGGTHVCNTQEIECFLIIGETSLATGVRRIEALTSTTAFNYLYHRSTILKQVEKAFSCPDKKVVERLETLQNEMKIKQKEIESLKDKIQSFESKDLFQNVELVGQKYSFICTSAPVGSDLRKISDLFADKFKTGVLVLLCKDGEKTSILIRQTGSIPTIHCGNLLKLGLEKMNGRGGGKPDMAQGSGESQGLESALKILNEEIKKNLLSVK